MIARTAAGVIPALAGLILTACGPSADRDHDRDPGPISTRALNPATAPWFEDFSEKAGIDFVHQVSVSGEFLFSETMGSGAAWIDYDQDGRLDLFLIHNLSAASTSAPSATTTHRLYRQETAGRFRDVSVGSGLDLRGSGHGLAVGDVNNDGWPEIFLTEYDRVRLFLNRGGKRFEDVTASAGLTNASWSVTAAFLDYDRDGWLDLVVGNYLDFDPSQRCVDARGQPDFCGPQGFRPTVTRLFRNLGAAVPPMVTKDVPYGTSFVTNVPRFQDVTVSSGIARAPGKAMQVICADFDGDRWPDVFITDDALPNRLFMNQRDGTFVEEAVARGVAYTGMGAPAANMGVALGDIDHDGRFDLFVPHLAEENHTLWRQVSQGLFLDITAQAGLLAVGWHGTGFGAVFGDFDNDGALDLGVVNGRIRRALPGMSAWRTTPGLASFWVPYAEPAQLFAGDGAGQFTEVSAVNPAVCAEAMVGRGLAMSDFDDDGGLDLLAVNLSGPVRLARNVGRRGHWLGVRAIDPTLGGRDAYGAEVIVESGGRTFWRLVQPAFSYSCSHDPRVHVGLGSHSSFDAIVVRWPEGTDEWFAGGSADRYVTLRKGSGRPNREMDRDPLRNSASTALGSGLRPASAPSISGTPTRSFDSSVPSGAPGTDPGLPSPPTLDTAGLDPAVARLLEETLSLARREPQSAAAWGRLGSVLMHYEFVIEAKRAFSSAERLAPTEPRWPYLHALLIQNHDPGAALALLRRAAALTPAEPDMPRLRLAQFLAERGDTVAAEVEFRALTRGATLRPPALMGLARIHHQRGQAPEALRLLGPCLLDPRSQKGAHELLAAVQRTLGAEADARSTARKGVALPADQLWPDPFWTEAAAYRVGLKFLLADASALLDAGNSAEAKSLLLAATRAYPGNADGWYLLGWTLNLESAPAEAERALREHLRRSPGSPKGLAQLAVALLAQRRPAEALPVLEAAVELKPLWRELHSNLGFATLQLGRADDAERHYRNALAADPNHVPSYTALAELLLRRRVREARDEAHRLLRAAAALSSDDQRVRAMLRTFDTVPSPP